MSLNLPNQGNLFRDVNRRRKWMVYINNVQKHGFSELQTLYKLVKISVHFQTEIWKKSQALKCPKNNSFLPKVKNKSIILRLKKIKTIFFAETIWTFIIGHVWLIEGLWLCFPSNPTRKISIHWHKRHVIEIIWILFGK